MNHCSLYGIIIMKTFTSDGLVYANETYNALS